MSKKIVASLCIVYLSVSGLSSFASDTEYNPDELILRFAPKETGKQRTLAEKNELLALLNGATVKHSYKLVPGLTVVKLPPNIKVKDAVDNFNKARGILYAEPNYRIKTLSVFPNDPNFDQQWALHNIGQPHPMGGGGNSFGTPDADIDAPEAWGISTNSNIIVAVIDTGVDYNHPDLKANMWINPGEDHPPLGVVGPEDFDGVNDDGNGYIDDV